MRGFRLDQNGDLVLNKDLAMLAEEELLKQTCQTILSTNKREWFFNEEEGINFANVLSKTPDEDLIRDEILSGLLQVDSTFYLSEFEFTLDPLTREGSVTFVAINEKGIEIKIESPY